MAIVALFSGTFCHGDEIADRVAARLGYERVDRKLLNLTSVAHGVVESRLEQTLRGERPLLNRFTHERERNLAYMRLQLAKLIEADNFVCQGFASHLLPRNVRHVLWICLVANHEYRVERALQQQANSRREAQQLIAEEERTRAAWTRSILSRDPYDSGLYDAVFPMQSTPVEDVVDRICSYARHPALRKTSLAIQGVKDFILASEVGVKLAERGHDVNVRASDGHVLIEINKYVVNLERHKRKLEVLAREVPGVRFVESVPGLGFVPPPLTRDLDLGLPEKILLVDDEREFVQTLSERLQDRNLPASIAYGGEEALAVIAEDAPEVMVLDLKMPGIDGLEVLRRVKREHPDVEVIILTGQGSEKEREAAIELGAFAYLRKPVDVDALAEVMRQAYRKLEKERDITEN